MTRALADGEHGWNRAQVLIGEDAGLRKSADGTWSTTCQMPMPTPLDDTY